MPTVTNAATADAPINNAISTNTAIATVNLATAALSKSATNENHIIVENTKSVLPKTDAHQKFYQQALYYYFQGNYAGALAILNQSEARLKAIEPIAQLFEAGLQVKVGLQEQARQNLQQLITKLASSDTELNYTLLTKASLNDSSSINAPLTSNEISENQSANQAFKINSQQLLVLALLSLAEQYIEQGEMIQAQQSLAKIQRISPRYYQQYQVLSQLAYWPKQPMLLPPTALNQVSDTSSANSTDEQGVKGYSTDFSSDIASSPYAELNNALRFIEEGKFEQAISLLNQLKSREWQSPDKSFFQLLFSNDDDSSTDDKEKALNKAQNKALNTTQAAIQSQAIVDYARLLLAHLYSQQEAYGKVYDELKTFPQQSNYIESALFLYAFSAQKIKQYTIALTLFNLLHQQYPYSTLGWQAGLLIAKQVTEQQGLAPGWQSYQNIESFYLNAIEELSLFEQSFEQSFAKTTDLLAFSLTKSSLNADVHNNNGLYHNDKALIEANFLNVAATYQPESIWLKQAMLEPSVNSLYQQLSQVNALLQHSQLLQSKSDEILNIIDLNTKRKARIAKSQQTSVQASKKYNTYETLKLQSDNLAVKLSSALNATNQSGVAFADETEQVWLSRLKQSKESLAFISQFSYSGEHSHEAAQQTNLNSQQRLNRLEGVLAWRLSQTFPERAWQHQQQLDALKHSLKQLEKIQTNVTNLMAESANEQGVSSLQAYVKRQQIADSKISPLVDDLTQLKAKITFKIREKVARFSQDRKALLAEYLLTTRKAMAAVLEQMSVNDNKIEKQLNSENAIKQGVSTESTESALETPVSKESIFQKQATPKSTSKKQAPQKQASKALTAKEQAINDKRAKLQAIKALREALKKKEPNSPDLINNEPSSKENNTTKQDTKGAVL